MNNRLGTIAAMALFILALAVLLNVVLMVAYLELTERGNTVYQAGQPDSKECSTYRHEHSGTYYTLCETQHSTTTVYRTGQ